MLQLEREGDGAISKSFIYTLKINLSKIVPFSYSGVLLLRDLWHKCNNCTCFLSTSVSDSVFKYLKVGVSLYNFINNASANIFLENITSDKCGPSNEFYITVYGITDQNGRIRI
jgi:hypothetical protein